MNVKSLKMLGLLGYLGQGVTAPSYCSSTIPPQPRASNYRMGLPQWWNYLYKVSPGYMGRYPQDWEFTVFHAFTCISPMGISSMVLPFTHIWPLEASRCLHWLTRLRRGVDSNPHLLRGLGRKCCSASGHLEKRTEMYSNLFSTWTRDALTRWYLAMGSTMVGSRKEISCHHPLHPTRWGWKSRSSSPCHFACFLLKESSCELLWRIYLWAAMFLVTGTNHLISLQWSACKALSWIAHCKPSKFNCLFSKINQPRISWWTLWSLFIICSTDAIV